MVVKKKKKNDAQKIRVICALNRACGERSDVEAVVWRDKPRKTLLTQRVSRMGLGWVGLLAAGRHV